MSEIDTKKLTTMKAYRIDNGWVVEKKEGDFFPKITACTDHMDVVEHFLVWLASAGVKPQQKKELIGLANNLRKK
jgi:hypothetical protein